MSAITLKVEGRKLGWLLAVFLLLFWLPVGWARFDGAILEALALARWYAREHVVLCLIPAFFIAGAISVFISQDAVIRYLGPRADKVLAYGVASVSGSILAVCSCTVLPLFAGIHRMGAGLGPACAFLYAGPAVNVLAIILTARVLGFELGVARGVGAIVFSIVIGLLMHVVFRRSERERPEVEAAALEAEVSRPLWQNALFFASMVGILVFANWGDPGAEGGLRHAVHASRWVLTIASAAALSVMLVAWFGVRWWGPPAVAVPALVLGLAFPGAPMLPFAAAAGGLVVLLATTGGEATAWLDASWSFTKQIMPLLLFGVLAAGALLGRPGHEGLVPADWIAGLVGGNSFAANLFASVVGAFMYFATLTEVPILQGLIGSGMGKGPALALLLSGPALSLPNMLVIGSIMGARKTVVFIVLVIVMSTLSGVVYGALF